MVAGTLSILVERLVCKVSLPHAGWNVLFTYVNYTCTTVKSDWLTRDTEVGFVGLNPGVFVMLNKCTIP